jgi:hypothetical protein
MPSFGLTASYISFLYNPIFDSIPHCALIQFAQLGYMAQLKSLLLRNLLTAQDKLSIVYHMPTPFGRSGF